MNPLSRFVIGLMLVVSLTSQGLAQVAVIQTSAPLTDHSEESIAMAFEHAVRAALRSAVAMGLPWVQLRLALVGEDRLTVEVLAMEGEPDDDSREGEEGDSDGKPTPGGGSI